MTNQIQGNDTANSARGEAMIAGHKLRPTFQALVAAEEEIGPLFEMVERASTSQLKLSEMIALFWHCILDRQGLDREYFAEAIMKDGLVKATPALKILLGQILAGR